MDQHNTERLAALFEHALTLPPEDRRRYARDACAEDAQLCSELLSLLAAHDEAPDYLERLADQLQPAALAPTHSFEPSAPTESGIESSASLRVGQRFGHYEIGRLLGQGGMGHVWEAADLATGRHVALKTVRPTLRSAADRARFLQEGRLAASVNHPNVVYVFGTEEIEGIPTIAMELLPGGTLKDRVKERGPVPPAAAVDAILQVIAGLEAMHAVGVLHRDVKPSNCFVDADGTVKVGDFGLSISTLARDVSQLTTSGVIRGTPQFAAPEQLKGDLLDVRADIYGVGATLFYLLTGQPPFDDTNLLALVTRIATEAPRSPRALVPSLPRGLAAIVLRCLARDRTQRPANYTMLSDELQPFSSAAGLPAPIGLRVLAGIIDDMLLGVTSSLLGLRVSWQHGVGASTTALALFVSWATIIAYYTILEGVWGASIGKRLVGLRVALTSSRPPGVSRAAGRSLIFGTLLFGGPAIRVLMVPSLLTVAFSALISGAQALLFSTARRSNGFAAAHDLWTGTRVVHRVKEARRPVLVAAAEPAIRAAAPPRRMGPFDVIGTLGATDAGSLLLGFDPRLRRRVWLHELPAETAKVAPLIRDLNRPGRLRWLGDRRTSTESWDAYEALDGRSLVTLLDRPQPWRVVRVWLADLAQEIDGALKDESLGRLSLDRVWITREGRAKLLDFRAPGAPDISAKVSSEPVTSAQTFLSDVATCALSGRLRDLKERTETDRRPRHTLPVSACALLDALDRGQVGNWAEVVEGTRALMKRADRVQRGRRAATLALCAAWALSGLLTGAAQTSMRRFVMGDRFTEVQELSDALSALTANTGRAFDRAAAETYIAGRFGPTLTDAQLWTSALGFLPRHRQLIERIVTEHPRVSPEEMAAATAVFGPFLERQASMRRSRQSMSTWLTAWSLFALVFQTMAVIGIGMAWLFRGGLVLRAFGVEVVTRIGTPASRLRTLWRGLLAWSPVIIAAVLLVPNQTLLPFREMVVLRFPNQTLLPREVAFVIGVCAAVIFVVGAVWALVYPERGLQDRIAGTYLVPR